MENLWSRMGEVATLISVQTSILARLTTESLSSHAVQELHPQLCLMSDVLHQTEKCLERVSDVDSETLKRWLGEVSKALYEASDLVDDAVANSAASSFVSKLRFHSLFGARMGAKINRLRDKLAELQGTSPHQVTLKKEPRPEVQFNVTNLEVVVGREDYKETVVNHLLDTSNPDHHISVFSIIGVGGIGKTTLAKLVYDDERITDHFDLKLWVHVSRDSNLKKILAKIMENWLATPSTINNLILQQIADQLSANISGKLFFLVLDDVWNLSHDEWSSLIKVLKPGARGTKILLTTRFYEVERFFGTGFSFRLKGMSYHESWFQFKRIAFGHLKQEQEPTEDIILRQKTILSRFKGVPCALLAFATVLQGTSLEKWPDIIDQFDQMLTPSESSILDCLELSYRYLASPLKPCFALCSLFPTAFEINFSDLVSLWMAHGYIESQQYEYDIEDIAEKYLMHFKSLGLFTDLKTDEHGKVVTFKMHDRIHDLARHVATDWGTVIHMYIHERDKKLLQRTSMTDDHKLHTFLCWTAPDDEMISINDILEMSNFKSLRVLDLHAYSIDVLPDSIGNLIHLRYLDLSHNQSLQKLPKSITNLHHLQTLKLDFCYELKELPTCFGKLVHLKRLELDGCENLTFMPPGFENLSSLRVLSRYMVGRPRFQSASGLKSLGNLNHLRGRLSIELSENWATSVNEAAKSNLINKTQLTDLRIKWEPTRHTGEVDEIKHQKLLLDGLQPPPDLKGLRVEGYRGHDFPSWVRGNELATTLPNLINISIDGCGQSDTLPPFSCLPLLKRLSLQFMHNVQFFENSDNTSSTPSSQFFPSLQELTLHSFYSLEGWWKEEVQTRPVSFNCLRKLKLWSCPKLKSMPLFPNVVVLDMQNINEKLLKIHNAQTTKSECQTSTLPSSSSSNQEISNSEPRRLLHLKMSHINGCPHLKTLDFIKSSNKLEKLVVEKLDMLSSFISLTEALKQLSKLKQLEIASCRNLDLAGGCQLGCGECTECSVASVPWKYLSTLEHLTLRELPKLVTLPVGLTSFTKLGILCISTCNNFNALPERVISNLNSLQHLRLEGCPALTMLPEGLKGIRSLVKIDIIECPQLMERCRDGGADWYKIKNARVLCHKTWRYAMMSDVGIFQKQRNRGGNVVVCSEDPTIHVNVTIQKNK